MKRVLSWLFLSVVGNAVYYVILWYLRLAFWLHDLAATLHTALYLGFLLIIGLPMFGALLTIAVYGAVLIVSVSQKIYKSRKGTRYVVVGLFLALYYLLFVIANIIGFAQFTGNPLFGYLLMGSMIVFSIALIFVGRFAVKEDGPPPSKRERLEAKLQREIDKEANKK